MKILVDPQDQWLLNEYKFYIVKPTKSSRSNVFYAHANISRYCGGGDLKLHQAIFGRALSGFVVDHINGNGLDNRRSNLRYISHGKNCVSTRKKPGKSGIRGVYSRSRIGSTGAVYSEISAVYRGKRLGTFKSVEDAEYAYLTARKNDFGNESCLNYQ